MLIEETPIVHGNERARDNIFCLDTYDCQLICTGGTNGELKLWSSGFQLIQSERRHEGGVVCARFSRDGNHLATGGDDGKINIYAVKSGKLEHIKWMPAHDSDIVSFIWYKKGLISGSFDGHVNIFDRSFKLVRKMKIFETQIKGMSIDPHNKYVCIQGEAELKLFDENLDEISSIESIFQGRILEAFFARTNWTPDSRYLSAGLAFNRGINTLEILQAQGLKKDHSVIGHVAPVEVAAFNPRVFKKNEEDPDYYYVLAVCSQDKTVSFWTSLYERPFLLIHNLVDQPFLDICWASPSILYICGYEGKIIRIHFDENELGMAVIPDLYLEISAEVPLSAKSVEITSSGILTPNIREAVENEIADMRSSRQKTLTPILLDTVVSDNKIARRGNTTIMLFEVNYEKDLSEIKCQAEVPYNKSVGYCNVTFNRTRDDKIMVSKFDIPLFTVSFHRLFYISITTEYLVIVTKDRKSSSQDISIYNIGNGLLICPKISFEDIYTIDVFAHSLLIVHSFYNFSVLNLQDMKLIARGTLPSYGKVSTINLDESYFLVIGYANKTIYFYDRGINMWLKLQETFNTPNTVDTAFESINETDESFQDFEYQFLVYKRVDDFVNVRKTCAKMCEYFKTKCGASDYEKCIIFNVIAYLIHHGGLRYALLYIEELNKKPFIQDVVLLLLNYIKEQKYMTDNVPGNYASYKY